MRLLLTRLVLVLALIASIWLGILYYTYGKQTLLYLVRSSPELVWNYTKSAVEPNSPSQPNNQLNSDPLVRPRESLPPIPSKYRIETMSHSYQKLNNCGPASASMAASAYGIEFDQFQAADILKGGPNDKNVSAHEMVKFLESRGLKVAYRLNGNNELLERLVAQNIPVLVEQWLEKRENNELVGHYRVVRGYDQEAKLFTTNDSFNGPNFVIPYSQFDKWWRPFNRAYLVVYLEDQESLVKQIMQTDWDKSINWEDTLKVAQTEVESIGDGYSYFNMGSAYVRLKKYSQAVAAYDQALNLPLPPNFLWYEFGPLEAYYQTGDYEKVFSLTDKLLSQAGEVEEARYYRGLSYNAQGKLVEARMEEDKTLAANPRFLPPFE